MLGTQHDLSGSPPTPMLDHRRVESTMDMSSYRIVPGSAARRPLQRLLEHTPPEDSPSPGDATVLDERAFQERETLLREKKHDQDTATHPVAHLTEHVAHSPKLPFGVFYVFPFFPLLRNFLSFVFVLLHPCFADACVPVLSVLGLFS